MQALARHIRLPVILLVALQFNQTHMQAKDQPKAPCSVEEKKDNSGKTRDGRKGSGDKGSKSDPKSESDGPVVELWELRAPSRRGENLNLVDGLDLDRDIEVTFCRERLFRVLASKRTEQLKARVRVWLEREDRVWREIDVDDLSYDDFKIEQRVGGKTKPPQPGKTRIHRQACYDPAIIIPLKREKLKLGDRVRVLVEVTDKVETNFDAPGAESVKILDHTMRLGRFGLHPGFSDGLFLIQRLGEDSANARLDPLNPNSVLFDSVNFRPAVGLNYGFVFYNRSSSFLQFLEPGFGTTITVTNWEDQLAGDALDVEAQIARSQVGSRVQIGMGFMGSVFDNTVVANLLRFA